jgi:hypothetical protein
VNTGLPCKALKNCWDHGKDRLGRGVKMCWRCVPRRGLIMAHDEFCLSPGDCWVKVEVEVNALQRGITSWFSIPSSAVRRDQSLAHPAGVAAQAVKPEGWVVGTKARAPAGRHRIRDPSLALPREGRRMVAERCRKPGLFPSLLKEDAKPLSARCAAPAGAQTRLVCLPHPSGSRLAPLRLQGGLTCRRA